tara:strand:+ start:382 stop:834 length:453 start_codon:yes stop_codon:yes gene_type:complete
MATITEQKAELTSTYKAGKISDALYVTLIAALNAQLGSDLRISTQGTAISLNVPPLQQVLEKPKKNRQGEVVSVAEGVKGGLISLQGTANGSKLNSLYINAETMLWICRNADAIQDYMKQDHLTMRRASQTLISAGALTQAELFGETVEA